MRTLLIAVAALMLAGCSENSVWWKANNAWGTGTFPVANDGQAALYIVREGYMLSDEIVQKIEGVTRFAYSSRNFTRTAIATLPSGQSRSLRPLPSTRATPESKSIAP